MAGALVLAPVLLLADIWSSPQLRLRPSPPAARRGRCRRRAGAAARRSRWLIARRPSLLALLAVAALPFRIPIEAGGVDLEPARAAVSGGRGGLAGLHRPRPCARPTTPTTAVSPAGSQRLLALYVVVYALQSIYSTDFEKALQQMVFFYVPFALLFGRC